MSERDQEPSAGVPRLIDQYKQRRQAWLAQADELVRLRDEVRSAAEREALEIVTAARRDVRRIVVEARRELLVLTAQLHAAIESVDQTSLHAAAETASGATEGQTAYDVLSGQRALGATEDLVLGARREVRTVLDEARAEIEALAAGAHGPIREIPARSSGLRRAEPPIPSLDALLSAESLSGRTSGARSTSNVVLEPLALDSTTRTEDDHDDGPGSNVPADVWQSSPETPAPSADEPLSDPSPGQSRVQAVSAHAVEHPAAEPVPNFTEAGTLYGTGQSRTFLVADSDDDAPRTRLDKLWVGLFATTGVLAVVGSVWWFTMRDTSAALATSITEPSEPEAAAAVTPVVDRATAPLPASSTGPSGLGIEVRRTSWIRTIVDGKEDSRVYQPGETRHITSGRSVSIRAGDGGAVFVSVDGRPAEALGSAGVAVTRQYSLAGGSAAPVAAVATASSAPTIEPVAATPPSPSTNNVAPARPEAQVVPVAAGPRLPAEATRTAAPAAAPSAAAGSGPAPAAAAAPPAPELETTAPTGGGRADLIAAGQQWLDAHQRRDSNAMSSSGGENTSVSDERSVTERFPVWQAGVRRDLDQLELELSGDTAVLTARMTERSAEGAPTSAQHVSRVSQIWLRRTGRWRLAEVRIIGEARLNQIVR